MVKIYIIRHGNALSPEVDPERPLSLDGKNQVEKIGAFLKKNSVCVERIIHSGKRRAEQTACIIAQHIGYSDSMEVERGLAPNTPVKDMASFLKTTQGSVMLVGHLPFMSYLASALVSEQGMFPFMVFNEAAAACFTKEEKDKNFHLVWFVSPDNI